MRTVDAEREYVEKRDQERAQECLETIKVGDEIVRCTYGTHRPSWHQHVSTKLTIAWVVPIPADIFCPRCAKRHVDEGIWKTKPHLTHRCVKDAAGEGCGAEWRGSGVSSSDVAKLAGTPQLYLLLADEGTYGYGRAGPETQLGQVAELPVVSWEKWDPGPIASAEVERARAHDLWKSACGYRETAQKFEIELRAVDVLLAPFLEPADASSDALKRLIDARKVLSRENDELRKAIAVRNEANDGLAKTIVRVREALDG